MKRLYSIYFMIAALFIQSAIAQMTFSEKTDFPTGANPYAVCSGDLNGDGKPDMAVVNFGSDTVSVYLNTTIPGAATPTFTDRTGFATGSQPVSVLISDINRDGMPDLVVTDEVSDISVFLNTMSPGASTPTFSTRTDFATGSNPESSCAGDINGDGLQDLIAANGSSNSISVLLNTTTPGASVPSFTAKTDFATGSYPTSVLIEDINGDGKLDVATVNFSSGSVSVLLNTTTPGASTPAFSSKADFAVGTESFGIAAGDLNGDGKPDLAVTRGNSADSVSVLLNTTSPGASTPTFTDKTNFATGHSPYPVSVEDINEDGKMDLVTGDYGTTTISVLLNNTSPGAAAPSFSEKIDFSVGTHPLSVRIADLNGDYKQDIITSNMVSNTVSILLNTTGLGVATPAFSAKTDFTTGNSPFADCIGDFNKDGMPDLATANLSPDNVSVLLNTTTPGATSPTFSGKTDFTAGDGPISVANGDLNGDGKNDLAVANFSTVTVSVMLNTTNPGDVTPSFSAKTDFTTGSNPYSISIGDINGNGKQDLVTANYSEFTASILINTTSPGAVTPSFSARTDFATGNYPDFVIIKDLNGDGKPDLTVARNSIATLSILINKTAPGSATPVFTTYAEFSTGSVSYAASIDDLNGDGKPDFAVANYNTDNITILFNSMAPGDTIPSFPEIFDFPTGVRPTSISIDDFNGDGKPDLAVTNSSDDSVSVLLNTTTPGSATPSFLAATNFATGRSPNFISTDDLNADGKPDLAIANASGSSISVLLNEADLSTGVKSENNLTPAKYGLAQNYPNPFNPSTKISFTLTKTEHAKLAVFNLLGQHIRTLFDGIAEKQKEYAFDFNASSLCSGIYFYRIQTPTRTEVRKMLLLK